MRDRDVSISDLIKAFHLLGCKAAYAASFVYVSRGPKGIKQHLHKGEYDTVRRLTVRKIYTRLGFSSEDFYRALDSI